MKKALITGITGQDGSYLAEFLLKKGYEVHGIKRRSSSLNTGRIDAIYQDPHENHRNFYLHYGDMADGLNISKIIHEIRPDEIYNLAAQSHVAVSFAMPEYTANVCAMGALRLLEGIKSAGITDTCRYYQASTSELYGLVKEVPQRESTPFYPRSPYAVAKLYAYWITVNYREAFQMFACNGILFNHESERRGETFVTRKITRGLSRIVYGLDTCLYLGNLDALRDWGHAKDYVEAQWLMLQQDLPKDYVISTGQQISVRDFVCLAAEIIGITLEWRGEGIAEEAVVKKVDKIKGEEFAVKEGATVVRVDPAYFRPAEVDSLLGDSDLARSELGWNPKFSIDELVFEMVSADLRSAEREYKFRSS